MMSGPHFEQLRTRLKGLGFGEGRDEEFENFSQGKGYAKISHKGGCYAKISHKGGCYAKISHMHYSHAHLKF